MPSGCWIGARPCYQRCDAIVGTECELLSAVGTEITDSYILVEGVWSITLCSHGQIGFIKVLFKES